MLLTLHHTVPTAVRPSPRVLRVAGMFGLGLDEARELELIPPVELELLPGQVVFITGPSGSGKSTLLRLIAAAVAGRAAPGAEEDVRVVRFDELPPLPDAPLVDCLGDLPLEEVLALLSLAGLNDAFVLLRRPAELSDGQRYRLRLAQVMAEVAREGSEKGSGFGVQGSGGSGQRSEVRGQESETQRAGPSDPGAAPASGRKERSGIQGSDQRKEANNDGFMAQESDAAGNPKLETRNSKLLVILADEFGATLDRVTARVLARNVRKWTRRAGPGRQVCFVAATTHDDLLEAFEPDVLVVKELGPGIEVVRRLGGGEKSEERRAKSVERRA